MMKEAGVYEIALLTEEQAEDFWADVDHAGIEIPNTQSLRATDGRWVTLVELEHAQDIPEEVLAYGWKPASFEDFGDSGETHALEVEGNPGLGIGLLFGGVAAVGFIAAWMKRKKKR